MPYHLGRKLRCAISRVRQMGTARPEPFHDHYRKMVAWCRSQESWNEASATVLAHMAYGWMPRMLEKHLDTRCLAKVLNCKTAPATGEPEELFRLVNKSLVGTSKVYHFRWPEEFPIWDARFATVLGLNSTNFQHFRKYVDFMRRCVRKAGVVNYVADILGSRYQNQLRDLSAIRQLEFCLYLAGG